MLFFLGCQNEKARTTKDYYYPIDEWSEGMVYEYQPVNNSELPAEYWYFRKLKTDTATYLTGQYYDFAFTPKQIFNAKVEERGVIMKDYILYEYDSLGNVNQNPAEIIAAENFPFEELESAKQFIFKLKWLLPTEEYPDGYLEVTRKRHFHGDAAFSFKNKSYDCIDFKLNELMDDFNDGHLEKEFKGVERFAKNLGLVYYKKEIDENFVLEYELRDTFSMKKFEEKFNTYLSEEK